MTTAHRLRTALMLAVLMAYVLLNHHLAQQSQGSNLTTLMACLPLLLAGMVLAWRQRSMMPKTAMLIAFITAPVLCWPWLKNHPANIYFIQHIALFSVLTLWFGRSLFGQRQAICTHFARFDQPVMNERVVRYTRRITLAWTLFFMAMVCTSIGLFLFTDVRIWSIFVNFLSLPLVALMFVIEYAVRCQQLPEGKTGITSAFRAYRQAMAKKTYPTAP